MKPTSLEVHFLDDSVLDITGEGELEVKQIENWLHVFGGVVDKSVLYALPAASIQYIEYGYSETPRISLV